MFQNKENAREIIVYDNEFWEFYNAQNAKVREKILWTIRFVAYLPQITSVYFKHIEGTDVYEIRVIFGGNIYRIFCFFDDGKLVVLLNGFQKKSQKTPINEIEKALKLKQQYYDDKK